MRNSVQGCATEAANLFGGVPRGWGADWQDLAWWWGYAELNRVVARPVCGWAARRALGQYEDVLRPTG